MKFSSDIRHDSVRHDWGNRFCRQPSGAAERLLIGPTRGHVDLMLTLAAELHGGPWHVLYILPVPRNGAHEAGRYEFEPFQNYAELDSFMLGFRSFFETDGRHHVWIKSGANDGLLVYDHHDVIFAYGPLPRFEQILHERGFRAEKFWFPVPHQHGYVEENDAEEDRMFAERPWRHTPLRPGDAWE